VHEITSRLKTIRAIAPSLQPRASKTEVERMAELAVEINKIMASRVDMKPPRAGD
jgi:hypothetical protein